jgi:hypothetical protein
MATSRTGRPKYENPRGWRVDASERRRGDGARSPAQQMRTPGDGRRDSRRGASALVHAVSELDSHPLLGARPVSCQPHVDPRDGVPRQEVPVDLDEPVLLGEPQAVHVGGQHDSLNHLGAHLPRPVEAARIEFRAGRSLSPSACRPSVGAPCYNPRPRHRDTRPPNGVAVPAPVRRRSKGRGWG